MRNRRQLVWAALVLGLAARAARAGDPEPARLPAFNPQTARLVAATDRWTVWTTRELIESTRMDRAQSHITRYYRQRVDADTAELAYEMSGTAHRRVATVLADGTLLLTYGTGMLWAAPGKPKGPTIPVKLDGENAHVLDAWPDGAVLQPYGLNSKAPLYFVPVAAGDLDLAKKILLTDEIGVEVGAGAGHTCRYGDQLAWGDAKGLHVYDLKQRSRRDVPGPKAERLAAIVAFDGSFTLTVFGAFDLPAGRQVPYYVPGRVLTLQNGIVYWVKEEDGRLHLSVTELGPAKPRTVELLAFPSVAPYGGRIPGDLELIPDEKGFRLWNGKEWAEVPWLKGLSSEK